MSPFVTLNKSKIIWLFVNLGSSPINPEEWAPRGWKYLNTIELKSGLEKEWCLRNFSIVDLLSSYGVSGLISSTSEFIPLKWSG